MYSYCIQDSVVAHTTNCKVSALDKALGEQLITSGLRHYRSWSVCVWLLSVGTTAGYAWKIQIVVEISYNVTEGTEYFVSFEMSVVPTEEYNVMIDREELIVTTEYLMV